MSWYGRFSVLMAICVLTVGTLQAQRNLATLVGTVKDASGAVVPGATVTARNVGTDATKTVRAGANGDYAFSDLDVGRYSIAGSQPGFRKTVINNIDLQTGQSARIDIVLQLGAVTQQVTVSGAAPMITTTNSDVGQVVNQDVLEEIPLNGRSFWQLTQLTPGATYTPSGSTAYGSTTVIRASAVNVVINGSDPDKTGWVLDGSSIVEVQSGGTEIQPDVDAIQEFKVESGNMNAEFGRTPATVTATIKSGTNQYHGDVFEFLRNSALDARNFFFVAPPGSSQKKDILKRNQFGGTIGGPIRKDKTFFFADIEETTVRQGVVYSNVVPSAAERQGDFSALLPKTQLVNPFDGYTAFANNQVSLTSTPATFSPQAVYFMNTYLPMPNFVQGTTSRYVASPSLALTTVKSDLKIDENISEKNHLMGRYSIVDNTDNSPDQMSTLGLLANHARGQDVALALTHTFNPHWLNELRFGFYRMFFHFGPPVPNINFSVAQGQDPGYQGFDLQVFGGFPEIAMSNYGTGGYLFDGAPSNQLPKSNHIRTYEYADSLSYDNGKHSMKFGMQLYHNTTGYITGSQNQGIFTFNGSYTGDQFADFLLGIPSEGQRDPGALEWSTYGNWPAWFYQDNYRVTQNFTLNLGLRYEINGFFTGTRGQTSGFDPTTGKLIIPSNFDVTARPISAQLLPLYTDRIVYSKTLGLPNSIIRTNMHDIAPRFGFAWDPSGAGKWAIRGGYGIFWDYADNNGPNNSQGVPPDTVQDAEFNNTKPSAPNRAFGNFFLGQPLTPQANPNPGQPCAPYFNFTALTCFTPSLSTTVWGNVLDAYTQEWNLTVQRELTHALSMTVAYVGNTAKHQVLSQSINNPPPGPGAIQERRPLVEYSTITQYQYGGMADYNALQVSVVSRSWHNLSLLGNYVYSHCIDDGSGGSGAPTFFLAGKPNRGDCTLDRTNTSAISYDYLLPVGHGQQYFSHMSKWANAVLGGWRTSGILTLQSGLPFTPALSGDLANTGVSSQRPDVISTPVMVNNISCWFYTSNNSSCTALRSGQANWWALPPSQVRYGTGGRDYVRGDGLVDLDFTLMKEFRLTESKHLEFRSEYFNLTNTPTFANPSATVNSSSGGQVSSVLVPSREIQFALKLFF